MRAEMTRSEFKKYIDSLLEEKGGERVSRRDISEYALEAAGALKAHRSEFKNDSIKKIASLIASTVEAVLVQNAFNVPELDPTSLRFSKN